MVMDAYDELTDRAVALTTHCEECEAEELADQGRSSKRHDLLVRASVREAISLMELGQEFERRKRK